jgi:hypothetical protein
MSDSPHPIQAQPRLDSPWPTREQEGWARSLGGPPDAMLTCSTNFSARSFLLHDFRGPATAARKDAPLEQSPAHRDRSAVEWETSPAEAAEATVFTWIGASVVRPAGPSYPQTGAALFINGNKALQFPLGRTDDWVVMSGDIRLRFEARRFKSLVENPDRIQGPDGVSGFYRLQVPAHRLQPETPLCLRVQLLPPTQNVESFFFVSPRADALKLDLNILREELTQVQRDLVQMRLANQRLCAQLYPELFPQRLRGERSVIHQSETGHLHPPSITALRDGELIVTMREASEHLDIKGRMIAVRSQDGGKSWSPKEVLFDVGNADHRSSPIFELPGSPPLRGEWLTTDYRAGGEYTTDGVWDNNNSVHGPTLWGAWSTDRGRSWNFTAEPMTVPGAHFPYAEAERHMIQVPEGRLLVAANYVATPEDGAEPNWYVYRMAVFASDDDGRHWEVLSHVPPHPYTVGEPTLLRNRAGRIILLSRTHPNGEGGLERGGLLQSDSDDEGQTWTEWRQTGMSSMGSPAHLLQLQDGRILCTHGSRIDPKSVYVTCSHDGGATWDTANTRIVADDLVNDDTCYPTSAQLQDGTLITVWYANMFEKFFIGALRYRPEDL